MSLPLLAFLVIAALALGYTLYGRLIASQYRLDDAAKTPAEEVNDGVDFVPTNPFYLLGQHFSAIAAAGPIAGPIIACALVGGTGFGWLPCILWIGLGVIFIGAVHDFSALVASVRHKARSIAEIVKENIGRRAWLAMLGFIWLAIVYVILAFADITAATFVGETAEVQGADLGGAVAAASVMYLLLSIGMGLVQKRFNPPLGLMTAIFVPATLFVVWLGTQLSHVLILGHMTWATLIMGYCFVAALIPVWLLLQPRGYLGGFVLYIALAVGVIGIFFGGFAIKQPATTALPVFGLGTSIFPFLFVTIACGACSGFHGLVCSGTTSKQIARETHCRPVGYGAMLLEGFVALIALSTVMILAPEESAGKDPSVIYREGLARFVTVLLGDGALVFATTFAGMAFSTFVFDTLDVATRLGRLILQELFAMSGRATALVATAVTAGVPLLLIMGAGKGGWRTFWTLFGTSNQLLAALTLLAITVWLKRSGRRYWFTLAPMAFIMGITLWSLIGLARDFFTRGGTAARMTAAASYANGTATLLFFALALFLAVESIRVVRRPLPPQPA
jgi:carbon starvation protein